MSPRNRIQPHCGVTDPDDVNHVPTVVVVDPNFDAYKPLAASARLGGLNLYFRASGVEAMSLTRRLKVDAWLVAEDLADVSGADFIDLLKSRSAGSRLAIVDDAEAGTDRHCEVKRMATEAGAAMTLSPPISLADLERLVGLPAAERSVVLSDRTAAARALVTLPVGVTAAAVAIAVLVLS